MGCFWIILIILLFPVIAYFIRIRQLRQPAQGQPDDKKSTPFTLFVRDCLGLYLLLLSLTLAYSIYRLMAVEFPPDQIVAQQQAVAGNGASVNNSPAATASASPVVPTIGKVAPNTLNSDSMQSTITVSGNNFSQNSRVRINGEERPTELTENGDLRATVDKGLPPGTIYVDVVNGTAFSNALPVQIVIYGKLFWFGHVINISSEARLLLIVLLAGALGSLIHAFQSLVDFVGNDSFKTSWGWWYIARPFIGTSLALVFYAALRGGLLAGTPASVKDVSPYGVFTIAALAGMFSDKATQKLADIFDVLFKSDDKRKDKLKKVSIKTTAFTDATLNTPYTFQLEALDGDAPYAWTATNLPAGLTLDSKTGIISGTPSAAGTLVTIEVKDSSGDKDSKTLNLKVN